MQITEVSLDYDYLYSRHCLITVTGTVSCPFDDLPEREDVLAFRAFPSIADREWVEDEMVVRADGYFRRSWRVLQGRLAKNSTET